MKTAKRPVTILVADFAGLKEAFKSTLSKRTKKNIGVAIRIATDISPSLNAIHGYSLSVQIATKLFP